MSSLVRIKEITLREVKESFLSPGFYLIMALASLFLGWVFFNLLVSYLESVHNHLVNQSNVTFSDGVLKPFFNNMNFLFVIIVPIFTMKLLASEKERGTMDLLFSSPLRPWELILGKFIAASLEVLSLLTLSFIIPIVIFQSNIPLGETIFTGYLAIVLNLFLYLSIGTFISSLSSNQNVSALMTLILILFFWMIPWAAQTSHNLILIEIYGYFGIMTHFGNILNGILTSSDLFYYFSLSFFFLSMAILFTYRRFKS